MCPDTIPVKSSRAAIAGDACLFTAAWFAVVSGVAGGIIALGWAKPLGDVPSPGVLGVVMQVVTAVLMLSSGVVGPVATWLLHRRRIGVIPALGAVLGFVVGGVALPIIAVPLSFLGMAIGRLTGVEVAGPIAILAIVIVAFAAVVVALDIDAVRDLSPARREHPRVDVVRIASSVIVVIFIAVTIGINVANPKSEVGEAGAFAIAAGVAGAVLVAVGDAVTTFADKRAAGAGADTAAADDAEARPSAQAE